MAGRWLDERIPEYVKNARMMMQAGTRGETRWTMFAVSAFDRNENGEILPTVAPLRQRSPHHAIWLAKELAKEHDGVIAWSREFDPTAGGYGPQTTLFVCGDIPNLD